MTIIDAIKEVMIDKNHPMTAEEVYKSIIDLNKYSFLSKNPIHIVNTTIRRHCLGLDFPSSKKVKYFLITEDKKSTSKYFLISKSKQKNIVLVNTENSTDKLPEEIINDAYTEHKENIKKELLDNILNSDPSFFEGMVVELLLKMDYGWDKKESGVVNGKVGDGGIDGIIYEDRLGLGKIYIQAKRYTKTSIGRPEIQQFVGAMENNQKGVYITTSTFTKTAIDFLEKQVKDIVLIDGSMLADLLVSHDIGISKVSTVSTYQIDRDYFDI